jgi:23S rRNA (adenine2503-C2)-methyltransferase
LEETAMENPDRNLKFTVPLVDGLTIEAVFYGSGTLCVSSQAGCALQCPFCASGSRGLLRNLSSGEMALQLTAAIDRGFAPKRVTISGIGEPLHNAAAVLAFMDICRSRALPVSLTTTGNPLQTLREFLPMPHNGLMLSLHAGSSETHRRLIPHGPDYDQLWTVLGEVLPSCSKRRRRKIGINYLLLEGLTDTDREWSLLAERMRPFPELSLHLLTCNPVPGSPYRSPPPEKVAAIGTLLAARGCNVRMPNRWRSRAEGGCGTLFVQNL